MDLKENKSISIPLLSTPLVIIFCTFFVLKILGLLNWSWWWITCPLWIGLAICIVVFIIILILKIAVSTFSVLYENKYK